MFEVKKFEFVLESVTPIAHHAETIGNHAIIFRDKVRQPGGGWASVPFVTGDTLRHALREAIAHAYLDAAGLLNDGKLSEAALRLLFAGGMVTGRGDASNIKLDAFREMVELCPSLGLLGGCANNRVIPGRTIVDDAVLICRETKHLMPEWVLDVAGELDTCRAHVEVEQRVRMDPLLSPEKVKLLSSVEQVRINNRLLASEHAHDVDDAVLRDGAKSTMMPRTFEAIARGSLLYWTVTVTCLSDLDVDTAHTMIASFLSNARVGGKRGTGHGLVRAVEARGVVVNRPSDPRTTVKPDALAPKMGEQFRAHVKARADRIATFLNAVDA